MILCAFVLFVTCSTINVSDVMCSYIGTPESLRQNIEELFQGKTIFSDGNLRHDENELSDTTPKNQTEYDFIVIGAGSAGAVIASRLSEIQNLTILLIEAGGKEYSIMDIPMVSRRLQSYDQVKWDYTAEISSGYCLGMENRQCRWRKGKVMGGSSVLNHMIATRGDPRDYDEWAEITGDDSWSYKNMLRYLKKLENFNVDDTEYNDGFHNRNGPLPITSLPYHVKIGEAFIEAERELGYDTKTDYNGAQQLGFSYVQSTAYDGERWSTNRAYLRPARNRNNLFVTRNSHVEKILIDPRKKTAYGARFSKLHETIEVKARKEIILSAGALNSPQILMLSGIGPRTHLRELRIKLIKDAPVGKNLMDHISYGGLILKVNDSLGAYSATKISAVNRYIESRSGPLARAIAAEVLGFADVDDSNVGNVRPNVEFMFIPEFGMKDSEISTASNTAEKYGNKLNYSLWVIRPMLMRPKSRGELFLRTKNPRDTPKIYLNYLDHPDDVRVIRKGIKLAVELSQTRALRQHGSELYDFPLPCEMDRKYSDAYWECAIRTNTLTVNHHSGTCKMGKRNDRSSVIDSNLKVHGVKRLRVVDASIMPKIVSAHPHIPVVAIAEKLSDVIKKEYGYIQ